MAVRDQFVEGVSDSTLRRELRKMVREKPESTLFDVCQEAIAWSMEEKPSGTRVAKSRPILSDSAVAGDQSTREAPDRSSATLDEILKVVSEQGKAFGELLSVVRESVTSRERAPKRGIPRSKFQFTDDGKPICFKCKGVGHIARECKTLKQGASPVSVPGLVQGN